MFTYVSYILQGQLFMSSTYSGTFSSNHGNFVFNDLTSLWFVFLFGFEVAYKHLRSYCDGSYLAMVL